MSPLQDLLAQRAEIEKKIADVQREERSVAINKVRQLMAEFGLTAADIASATVRVPRVDGMPQDITDIDELVRLLNAVEGHVNAIARTSLDLSRYEQQASSMLEKLESYISRLNGSQRQIDDAYTRVAGNFEQMQLISRQQADYLKSVSAMQNASADAMNALKDGAKSIEASANTLSQTGDKLIVEGLQKARPGSPVTAVPAGSKAPAAQGGAANAPADKAAAEKK